MHPPTQQTVHTYVDPGKYVDVYGLHTVLRLMVKVEQEKRPNWPGGKALV